MTYTAADQRADTAFLVGADYGRSLLAARIAAVLRLLEPDDITPTGARQIRRVLEGDQ